MCLIESKTLSESKIWGLYLTQRLRKKRLGMWKIYSSIASFYVATESASNKCYKIPIIL